MEGPNSRYPFFLAPYSFRPDHNERGKTTSIYGGLSVIRPSNNDLNDLQHTLQSFNWDMSMSIPEKVIGDQVRTSEQIDWNELFQSLVDLFTSTPFESDWRSKALQEVINLFTEEALPDAMSIINAELEGQQNYPFKPKKLGQAGGTKFIHKNKLFKLIGRETIANTYKGDFVAAMKVPQREISSINYLLSLNKPGLHIPLTVVISYGCYAVVVSALIPVDETTLVYGSNDGGRTVKDESEPFREMMEQVGQFLNLKKHQIGNSGKYLFLAADVEGHIAKDGRMYLLDTARLFPPLYLEKTTSQEWLYKLFKPICVKEWAKPLCSDAFSAFDDITSAFENQLEIKLATLHLINEVIPKLVHELDTDSQSITCTNDIKARFHEKGVNLQFVGHVFNLMKQNKTAKYYMLLSMIARSIKYNIVNVLFITQTHSGPGIEKYHLGVWTYIQTIIATKYGLHLAIDLLQELEALSNHNISTFTEINNQLIEISGISIDIDQAPSSITIQSLQPKISKISPSPPLFIEELEQITTELSSISSITQSVIIESKSRLADAYRSKHMYALALSLYQQVLELQTKILGPEHPDTITTMKNMASTYSYQGNYNEALSLYQQVLDLEAKILGPEHPSTLNTIHNMAVAYYCQGDYNEALSLYQQVLELQTKILGPEHPSTLNTMNNTASVYYNQGNYENAIVLYQQALELHTKILGSEHPDTLITKYNMAVAYENKGNYNEALLLYQQVLELQTKILGSEHPDTIMTMNNIAVAYDKQGNYDEAIVIHKQVLEVRTKTLGPEHPDAINTVNNITSICADQGNYNEALAFYQQALDFETKILGPEHPDTITTMKNMALTYDKQGNHKEAILLYRRILKHYIKTVGLQHTNTVNAIHTIALLYAGKDSYEHYQQGNCNEHYVSIQ